MIFVIFFFCKIWFFRWFLMLLVFVIVKEGLIFIFNLMWSFFFFFIIINVWILCICIFCMIIVLIFIFIFLFVLLSVLVVLFKNICFIIKNIISLIKIEVIFLVWWKGVNCEMKMVINVNMFFLVVIRFFIKISLVVGFVFFKWIKFWVKILIFVVFILILCKIFFIVLNRINILSNIEMLSIVIFKIKFEDFVGWRIWWYFFLIVLNVIIFIIRIVFNRIRLINWLKLFGNCLVGVFLFNVEFIKIKNWLVVLFKLCIVLVNIVIFFVKVKVIFLMIEIMVLIIVVMMVDLFFFCNNLINLFI